MSQVGTANLGGFAARHEDTDPAGKLRKYDIFWLKVHKLANNG